jgi:hypothetical protein
MVLAQIFNINVTAECLLEYAQIINVDIANKKRQITPNSYPLCF